MTERDDILEEAALVVERSDFRDWAGALAKRKRDREDSQLRRETAKRQREELAADIRALKTDRRSDPVSVLQRIVDADERSHVLHLRDAWPLAAKGLVEVTVTITATKNSIPPPAEYRIVLTEKGQELLKNDKGAGVLA